jgi:hypothetical protein
MEKTAVEWLYNKMLYIDNEYDMKLITKSEYQFKRRDIIEQAKEIEKEQIIDAYKTGNEEDIYYNPSKDSKQYYNEKFNKK